MRNWKRILTVSVAVAMLVAMVGCGKTETNAEPTAAPTEAAQPTEAPTEVVEPTEAPTETVEPTATPEPTAAPEASAKVITFADLTAAGYGYEATVADGAVNVTIAGQYQEIQYALPEVIDLAQYTTLVVDVTSNNALDIKLVNPEAELNEYSQLTPFLDNYTPEGAITAPVEIALADYANFDLSQINFMAMVNDTVFTINNISFK